MNNKGTLTFSKSVGTIGYAAPLTVQPAENMDLGTRFWPQFIGRLLGYKVIIIMEILLSHCFCSKPQTTVHV